MPIVREPDTVTGTRVLVGESRATHRLGVSPGKLSEQEYLIQFLPETLVLMGVDKADYGEVVYDAENLAVCKGFPGFFDEQGTMHAVYDFLRRYCGVRWFDSTELGMSYPETSTLTVRGSEVQRKPFFRYRHSMGSSSSNPVTWSRPGQTGWLTPRTIRSERRYWRGRRRGLRGITRNILPRAMRGSRRSCATPTRRS